MKKIFLQITGAIVFALAGNVYAGGDDLVNKITALRYAEEGIYVQFEVAPAACNGGAQYRMHALLQKEHSNYSTVASGLMSTHAAGKHVDWIFYLDSSVPASCDASVLILTAIEIGQ